ncbi:TPR-like protein [Dichomitus squalens]|uniref:TPR-like protein n=1 Tax=Dichomitus squalens TaxID=114155 RepID=A0A4Q9PPM3_9APHY|nr:TPR-like protein [Dichomitus squalens]TBU56104.1 TPR-like protein [Dichomitus squalens]
MQYSNRIKPVHFRPFLARWGVPWDHGSYFRTTTALNPAGIPAPLEEHALLPSVSMKSLHVKGAPRAHAVYLPTAGSHIESHVFAPDRLSGEEAEESPAVLASVGQGYLGYVGDVNGEKGSTCLILEMCGVKIQPGDLGERTHSTGLTVNPDGTMVPIVETETEIPVPPPPPPRAPRPRDTEVATRAEAREKVRKDKCTRADALKNEGNDLFKKEKWAEAAEKYRAAALLAGPQPVYLSNLAACFLKMELWELADSAATRALVHDPKHIKALYRRALARKGSGHAEEAFADLQRLLSIDRSNVPARKEAENLREIHGISPTKTPATNDQDSALEIEDESDSEDFAHPGTGIACRYYNTRDTGCRNGKKCRFRHAPDPKSIRDELGRNVCVYWLLGHCRFAAEGKCVYAHDATYLPARGWWTDTARLERMRAEFDDAIKAQPLNLGAGNVSESILAEAFVPLPWRKDFWAVASYEDAMREREEDSENYEDSDGYDSEEGRWDTGFGLTDAEVEELWTQGIKPWEIESYVSIVLYGCLLSDGVLKDPVMHVQDELMRIRSVLYNNSSYY